MPKRISSQGLLVTSLLVELNTLTLLKRLQTSLHTSAAKIVISLAREESGDKFYLRSNFLLRYSGPRGPRKVTSFWLPLDVRHLITTIAYELGIPKGEVVDRWVAWKWYQLNLPDKPKGRSRSNEVQAARVRDRENQRAGEEKGVRVSRRVHQVADEE